MDIVTWTFSRTREDHDEPVSTPSGPQIMQSKADISQVYIDANDRTRKLSAKGVRTLVRQLTSGLNHHGLNKGDTVCMVSFNDVSLSIVKSE